MLTLTPTASEAVRRLTAENGGDDSGIRISPGPETTEGAALELELVTEPGPEDTTVDDDGANVYLGPEVVGALTDMVLDAAVDEGQVTFVVRPPGDVGLNGAEPS